MTNRSILPFILTTVGAIALAPAVNAQTVDTSDWACEYCPFASGQRAEYELAITHNKLEATLNALPDLLFEVDAEGIRP